MKRRIVCTILGMALFAVGVLSGCSTAPPSVPLAVVERAELDFEQITRFRNQGTPNSLEDGWFPSNPIATGAQFVFHFPISYTGAWLVNAPWVVLGEGIECLFFPIMGSSLQDRIDDWIYQMYIRGVSLPHLWDQLPKVGSREHSWYGADRLPNALPILQLVASKEASEGAQDRNDSRNAEASSVGSEKNSQKDE